MAEATREQVIQLVNVRAGIMKVSLDGIGPDALGSIVDEVGQYIKNYCNITRIPDALLYVWAALVLDYIRYINETARQNDEEGGTDLGGANVETYVGSIKEGDVTVSYSQVSASSSSSASAGRAHDISGVLDAYVLNYNIQLQAYRQVKWNV